MRKFDLSLRSSRSSYFATFRHQLTILSKTDALDEEKWLNMLGTFVKDWFRYESHFVHGRDSLVDILKERGLLSESDAVQPLIGKRSEERRVGKECRSRWWVMHSKKKRISVVRSLNRTMTCARTTTLLMFSRAPFRFCPVYVIG